MNLFNIISILLLLAAVFSIINHKWLKLQPTIGIMLTSVMFSLGILAIGSFTPGVSILAHNVLSQIDFNKAVFDGMLCFLLFAGSYHLNLKDLGKEKTVIFILSTVGVVISTFVVGIGMWYFLNFIGFQIPFIYALLFGAIIAPTDPISVLAIMKTVGAPKRLETKVAGESLFNDGTGVVAYLVIFGIATGSSEASVDTVVFMLTQAALGGFIFGLVLSFVAIEVLKRIDNFHVEIIVVLAFVMGGYSLATLFDVSGPIAVVVAGIMLGSHGREDSAITEETRKQINTFWEIIDEVLNAMLFSLIGLEILVLKFNIKLIEVALYSIPIVLLARFIAVGLPISIMKNFRTFSPHTIKVLTWGGLRGGLSIAMALATPHNPYRDVIICSTYAVVLFSILVQGLTIKKILTLPVKSSRKPLKETTLIEDASPIIKA